MRRKLTECFAAAVLVMVGGWGSSLAVLPSSASATPTEFLSVSQQTNDPCVLFEKTATFGAEVIDGKHRGGEINIANPDFDPCTARSGYCSYGMGVYRGALSKEADVTLRVTANRQPTFSGHEAVGNEVAVELPLAALTLDKSMTVLRMFAPTFPDVYEANLGFISAEVNISFDGVVAHRYLRSYGLGVPVFVYVGNIVSAMRKTGARQAGTMQISVLPISSKGNF